MDELLSRQVPHSLEAEQSVLGSMLIDSRCVSDVIGMVRPEEFYLQQNRDIFETIYAMFTIRRCCAALIKRRRRSRNQSRRAPARRPVFWKTQRRRFMP